MTIYYNTQSSALSELEKEVNVLGYDILYPDYFWTEHVQYGKTVKYTLAILYNKGRWVGKLANKCLHVQIYRMDNGKYELNFYIN
jgi:hypothetical protein